MFLNKIRHIVYLIMLFPLTEEVKTAHRGNLILINQKSRKPIHVARMHPHTYGQRMPQPIDNNFKT